MASMAMKPVDVKSHKKRISNASIGGALPMQLDSPSSGIPQSAKLQNQDSFGAFNFPTLQAANSKRSSIMSNNSLLQHDQV
mmetsp:Transcript_46886/g.75024  ORF Transcript_46886/g.75024 Transcript_46886/m.75024 type:complete len:81 (+) Transcript_46886:1-243(+)